MYPFAEIQIYRNADQAKRYIQRHKEVYFHLKNNNNSKYSGHLKKHTELENVTISGFSLYLASCSANEDSLFPVLAYSFH